MKAEDFVLPYGRNKWNEMPQFCAALMQFQREIGFKLSSRGWGYQLEGFGLIKKNQFDTVERVINEARKAGFLPVDFTAEQEARNFSGVVTPEEMSIESHLYWAYDEMLDAYKSYIPDYWEDEEYYIQMLVEKIDLKSLFRPVCRKYRIPIATSKGWSSILQRAKYARRFKEAHDRGLQCVLLYCGDHDPDGLRISDFIRKNLADLYNISWHDGEIGYNPGDLIIDRFGLNADFIEEHGFTWIDNLITGSGRNLASPRHKNFHQEYVQDYLRRFGERKCEANSIIVKPDVGRELCRNAIEQYLGPNADERFTEKKLMIKNQFRELIEELDLDEKKHEIIKML